MGVLRCFGTASVAGALWLLACSEDEEGRKVPQSDSGTDSSSGRGGSAGRGGSGGRGGTGGTAAGTGGMAGSSAGTSGSGGTAPDAGDASIDAPADALPDTFDAGLQCPPVPAPDAGDAADGSDGGLLQRWRDWTANACRDCPAVAVECPAVAQGASFDPVTSVLRLELAGGTAEIVSGTLAFSWDALNAEGGYDYGVTSVPFTVDENRLVADLSNELPPNVLFIYDITVRLTDACGVESTFEDLHIARQPDPDAGPDAGLTWQVRCVFGE